MQLTVAGRRCHCAGAEALLDAMRPAGTPPVVLIHGAANDADVWRKIASDLRDAGHTVLVPDLPGHGLSRGKTLRSIEALADWLIALLDAVGVSRAVLAGHSMGSLIALEATARHPRRVSKLALLGSTAPMPVSEALLEMAKNDPDSACRMIAQYSHTPRFHLTGGGGHGVWGPGVTLAILRRSPSGVLATDLANCNRYLHGLEAAATIDCPTRLIVARRDRMTPLRNVQALQSALRQVTRSEIADCGHAMMNERPEAVAAALRGFLA